MDFDIEEAQHYLDTGTYPIGFCLPIEEVSEAESDNKGIDDWL